MWHHNELRINCDVVKAVDFYGPITVVKYVITHRQVFVNCLMQKRHNFTANAMELHCFYINSLWPSDAIRRQETESTLAQVMACCLTAPSHYLNQWWLIISKVLWHSSEGIIVRRYQSVKQDWKLHFLDRTQMSQGPMSWYYHAFNIKLWITAGMTLSWYLYECIPLTNTWLMCQYKDCLSQVWGYLY